MKIKCTKNLVNQAGHQDFTKDKEYDVQKDWSNSITENTIVLKDDEGMPHNLGIWHKHFKIVK